MFTKFIKLYINNNEKLYLRPFEIKIDCYDNI